MTTLVTLSIVSMSVGACLGYILRAMMESSDHPRSYYDEYDDPDRPQKPRGGR